MDKQTFLKDRQTGVGGSDIGAILGLSPWKTPVDIWIEKTNPIVLMETPSMYWGTQLEDLVAKEYHKRTGFKVQRVNRLIRHPKYPFAVANIDRAVINLDIAGNVRINKEGLLTTDRILECKTANGFSTQEWGEEGTDAIPETYICQCQWYLEVTGASYCDLAVLIGGNDFRIYHIHKNTELIELMLQKAQIFWDKVLTRTPPEPQSAEDVLKLFPESAQGKIIEATPEDLELCKGIQDLRSQMKALEDKEKEMKKALTIRFADAEEMKFEGKKIATWKSQSRSTFDSPRLKEEMPEIYSNFIKTNQSRVLRVNL